MTGLLSKEKIIHGSMKLSILKRIEKLLRECEIIIIIIFSFWTVNLEAHKAIKNC